MRTSIIAAFFILVSFSIPTVVSAQAADGSPCSVNADCASGICGGYSSIGGTCQASGGAAQVQTTGINTSVTQTTGVNTGGPSVTLINPLKSGTSLESFLTNILQFVIRIGSIAIILMLVYVGYLFVAAQGNESKITAARTALLWTVIGALVLLGAQAIASAIQATVNALGG